MLGFKWWKIYTILFYLINLFFWISFSFGLFDYQHQGFTRELFITVGLLFAILTTLLIYSLSLNIIAFSLITILSFNFIIWIINYIYIKNRLKLISNYKEKIDLDSKES